MREEKMVRQNKSDKNNV